MLPVVFFPAEEWVTWCVYGLAVALVGKQAVLMSSMQNCLGHPLHDNSPSACMYPLTLVPMGLPTPSSALNPAAPWL